MLYELKPYVVGKRLAARTLQKLLSNHIKYHLPIRVRMDHDPTHEKGLVYIGGAYYSHHDQNDHKQIEIVFSYKSKEATLVLSDHRWGRMCRLFADTILHEVVHMRQYRTRNFKDIPGYESTAYYARDRREQEYYGNKDEMGAFAFNIACEMVSRFGNDRKAIQKYMDSMQCKRRPKSTYNQYLRTFEYNHNHPIIRRMKKKILAQIDNAVFGKPFKTNDYLTY
jgi:hypothetical protein